jgi:hypothetical protein
MWEERRDRAVSSSEMMQNYDDDDEEVEGETVCETERERERERETGRQGKQYKAEVVRKKFAMAEYSFKYHFKAQDLS